MRLKVGAALALIVLLASSLSISTADASADARVPARLGAKTRGSKAPWGAGAPRAVPGRIVVVWRTAASRADARRLADRAGVTPAPKVDSVQTVRVARGASIAAVVREYRRSPLVRFAEPDRIDTVMAPPNDTHFGQQWALDNTGQSHKITQYPHLHGTSRTGHADADVDAPEAWAAQSGHDPVVVAVIDTGVDTTHPDLANSLWTNPGEVAANHIDDDGNGYVDDVHGWDFYDKDKNPRPASGKANSHGTHVSGIIAAERDNATGISGVCGDCQIMALRIATARQVPLSTELKAIDYAIDNGADVVNMSFGGPVWSAAERSAIKRAGNHGILVVAAAANSSLDNDIDYYDFERGNFAPNYPSSYALDNIVAVAASNDRDQYGWSSQCQGDLPIWRCAFTSWGHDSVDVAAPGVDILSTVTFNSGTFPGYDVWDGTSMATPMVAGIAGLVLSENPGFSPVDVKSAIINAVDQPNALKLLSSNGRVTGIGTKPIAGHFTRTQGRVNALAALTASTSNATPVTDGGIDGARSIDVRRSDRVSWPADVNDVYEKRLVDGRRYRVTVNGGAGADLDLFVWKPGTKDIFQFAIGCFLRHEPCPALAGASLGPHADEATTFTARRTGVFYIQVNSWYSHSRYAVKIRKV